MHACAVTNKTNHITVSTCVQHKMKDTQYCLLQSRIYRALHNAVERDCQHHEFQCDCSYSVFTVPPGAHFCLKCAYVPTVYEPTGMLQNACGCSYLPSRELSLLACLERCTAQRKNEHLAQVALLLATDTCSTPRRDDTRRLSAGIRQSVFRWSQQYIML